MQREERTGPTPETLAKRKNDPLAGLPEELGQAAVAIAVAYWRLCGHAMSRAASLAPPSPGKPPEFSGHDVVLILRYQAWMREALRRRLNTEALIDMIVDGLPLAECNQRHWPYLRLSAPALAILKRGLALYTKTRVVGLPSKLGETGDWPLTPRANHA